MWSLYLLRQHAILQHHKNAAFSKLTENIIKKYGSGSTGKTGIHTLLTVNLRFHSLYCRTSTCRWCTEFWKLGCVRCLSLNTQTCVFTVSYVLDINSALIYHRLTYNSTRNSTRFITYPGCTAFYRGNWSQSKWWSSRAWALFKKKRSKIFLVRHLRFTQNLLPCL